MIFNPILKQINLDNFVLKMKQKKNHLNCIIEVILA